jgi:hypothetical protein
LRRFCGDANKQFKAAAVQLKKIDKVEVNHHSEIELEDFKKLYYSDTLSAGDPRGLQRKVFFAHVMLFLCLRGRENLHGRR